MKNQFQWIFQAPLVWVVAEAGGWPLMPQIRRPTASRFRSRNRRQIPFLKLDRPRMGSATITTRWSLSAANSTAPLQYLYVGWLNGNEAMPQNVLTALQSAGITPQDYKVILAHDPFAAGIPMDPKRFVSVGTTFPYEPPLTPTDPVPQSSINLSTSQISTSGVSQEDSYGVQMSVSGGASFLDLFNAKITAKNTWTWTNKSTTTASTETSTAATATVGGPAYGYTGGTLVEVYYDTIYNTFAFVVNSITADSVALAGS